MKINNIFRVVILLALVATVTTSCRFEEEDLFETSANLRQEYANRDIKEILCSASENGGNGWVFQYFVAGNDDDKYPGFNLFCQFFDSGKVIIGGNHAYMNGGVEGKYMESASFYEMKKDEANTLAFTTWNDVLTPFVNPDSEGEGMHGDCDLVVMSWDEDEITFRGTRHSARSRLVRLDRSIDQYISDVDAMETMLQNVTSNPYVLSDGNTKDYIVRLNTGRLNQLDRIQDPLSKEEHPLVFTPNGFRTETECSSLDGNYTYQEFVYDQTKDCFVDTNNSDVTIDVAYKSGAEGFINSMAIKMYSTDADKVWNIDASADMSDNIKTDIDNVKSAYKSLKNHKFYFGYDSKTDKLTLTLYCKLSTTVKRYTYNFDCNLSDGSFTLSNPTPAKSFDSAGEKIKSALDALMADFAKEFKAEDTDSKWSRQTMKLVSADGTTYVNLN